MKGTMATRWHETERTESSRRTSTESWKSLRLRVLKRDDWQCQVRGPQCTGDATVVDHIIPVSHHGEDLDENAQAICAPCHHTKTGRDRAALRRPNPGKHSAPRHPADGPLQ
jgi:5-methylcytosine-specific restriction protein A